MTRREELRADLKQGVDVSGLSATMKAIDEINKILGDKPEVEDPLVDEWEAALDRGEEPEL